MKKKIIIISIILLIASSIIVFINGRKAHVDLLLTGMKDLSVEYDNKSIDVNYKIDDNNIVFDIEPIKQGKTEIEVSGYFIENNESLKTSFSINVYVHLFNIITINSYIGRVEGGVSFVISFIIINLLIIIYMFKKYKRSVKKNLYSYKNARLLGVTLLLAVPCILYISELIYVNNALFYNSISVFFTTIPSYILIFMGIVLPLAAVITVLVTISNIILIKKEGKSWQNLLGVILGGFICLSSIGVVLFQTFFIYIFDFKNIIFYYIASLLTMMITYLECVLFSTCVLSIKAAKRIPKFNKDYIIILGCGLNKDGSLPNLLKSRVDRAIEFSKMQKEETGKDIIFVPSGGQGPDEIISEGQAMKNYLLEQGINKKNILVEDKSTTTYENIKYSYAIIKEKCDNPKVAISTTNYHTFRAGSIASKQGINVECIGAKTKSYYWINAFIREFIATLVSEKKSHIKVLMVLSIMLLIITLILVLTIYV